MGVYVADQVSKLMYKNQIHVGNANVLIMGFAFKENCTDHRNTRVVDLFNQFKSFNCNVDIYDPWIDKDYAFKEHNIKLIDKPKNHYYDAIVIAVAHDKFKALSEKQIRAYGKDKHILYDIKYLLKASESDGRL
jgi:UDP-N-acetyl-D-galactosamine dehydrogenase